MKYFTISVLESRITILHVIKNPNRGVNLQTLLA